MIVIIILLVMATAYAITFQKDFPMELVYRTYIVFSIFMVLKNIDKVFKVVMEFIYSLF